MTPPTPHAALAATRATRPRDGILDAVGDTPLVRLRRLGPRDDIAVYAKLEALNPAGSAKDRTAVQMLSDAIGAGDLAPGGTVVESTSGNLGVGLAQACAYMGLRLIAVVDPRANTRTIQLMTALGADVRQVNEPDPATGDFLVARLAEVDRLRREIPSCYWPGQYSNLSNPRAHFHGTMREIAEALDGDVDVVLVATSTTGTLRGCADYVATHGLAARMVAVDAEGSVLFGGARGTRRLPGFGAGVETPLSREATFDSLMRVGDRDCVEGCRLLARREGILAGASGGGVVTAFQRLAPTLPSGSRCVIVLADGGAAYLDTVYDDAWCARELGITSERSSWPRAA